MSSVPSRRLGWLPILVLLQCSILASGRAHAAPDAPGRPAPASTRAEFEAALELIGRDDAAAAARLEALASASDAHGEYVADALVEAAQLYEEKLGRPDRARDLYAQVLAREPQSRLSLRARARLAFLDESLKSGAAPLAEYQRILYGFSTRPSGESARMMEALLAAHPDFVLADKAELWLAGLDARDGRHDRADERYRRIEARSAQSETWALARKGRADVALERGRPLEAGRLYRSILEAPPAARDAVSDAARAGITRARTALGRLALLYSALLFLAGFLVFHVLRAGPLPSARALPEELIFYLPIAALFVLAALRESRAIAGATAIIAVGGALIVLASSASTARSIARGRFGPRARALASLGLVAAAVALVYVAVHTSRLTDFVIETMRSGPDR